MRKAAIYARVSTRNGDQDVGVQLDELVGWAKRLNYEVVHIYQDEISGTKGADERPALKQALRDAHERRFDVLCVWALDRVSRGGIGATATILDRLKRAGVALKSYKEDWLDTTSPAVAELLTAIFSWVARQEAERIRDRVRAGLDRAKRRGTKSGNPIGRPRLTFGVAHIHQAIEQAGSVRGAARLLACDARTLRNRLTAAP